MSEERNFTIDAAVRQAVERALEKAGGNRSEAARLLAIGKTTLYRYLKRYEAEDARRECDCDFDTHGAAYGDSCPLAGDTKGESDAGACDECGSEAHETCRSHDRFLGCRVCGCVCEGDTKGESDGPG